MTKTTLIATDSFGKTFTRTTARDYAFVVVRRADGRYAASVQAHLDQLIAERAEAGDEAVAEAVKVVTGLEPYAMAAIKDNDSNKLRTIQEMRAPFDRLGVIDKLIEDAKKQAAKEQARAEAKESMGVTWHSRLDLAEKAAAEARENSSVEIVPVG